MPTRALTMILISLPVAGCTLAAGLADRKRPFSLLLTRITGPEVAKRLGSAGRALPGPLPTDSPNVTRWRQPALKAETH